MTARPDRGRGWRGLVIATSALHSSRLALLLGLLATSDLEAACLRLASHPDGTPLAQFEVGGAEPAFAITYTHSVTNTPVEERYRIEGAVIVQTEIQFAEHGPGQPTQAQAKGAWRREQGRYVVATDRHFESIALRVHGDQQWRLALQGDPRKVNLAQWGNRSIALAASASPCLTGPTGHGARVK